MKHNKLFHARTKERYQKVKRRKNENNTVFLKFTSRELILMITVSRLTLFQKLARNYLCMSTDTM